MTGRPERTPPAVELGQRVAANRAESERREAVRRRRRQTLPALVAGSATLAGTSLAVAWVTARMPDAPPPASVRMLTATPYPQAAAEQATVANLEERLAMEEELLRAVAATAQRAAGAGGSVIPPPAATASPPAPRLPASAARPVAPRPAAPPATHATTGASRAH